MPPKKAPNKVVKESPKPVDFESSSDDDTPQVQLSQLKPVVSVKYNSNDNDRVQLAQAINNLTVKGEQFMEAFTTFSKFRETVAELDIQIETKKKEFKELVDKVEKEFKEIYSNNLILFNLPLIYLQ